MERVLIDREFVAELIGAAVDAVPHPFGITDYRTVLYANSHACALHGVEAPEQLIGQPVDRFVHPDMLETMRQRAPLITERRQAFRDAPTKFVAMNGSVVCGISHLIPMEFDGRPCVLWMYKNMTCDPQNPNMGTGLDVDDDRLALVFDALPDPMLIHDDRHILAANATCRWLLGAASSGELVGLALESIVHPDGQAAGEARRNLLASECIDRLDGVAVKLVRRDGRQVRIVVDGHVIRAGARRAFLVTARMA